MKNLRELDERIATLSAHNRKTRADILAMRSNVKVGMMAGRLVAAVLGKKGSKNPFSKKGLLKIGSSAAIMLATTLLGKYIKK